MKIPNEQPGNEAEQMMRDLSAQGWYSVIRLPSSGGAIECIIGRDEWATSNTAQAIVLPHGKGATIKDAMLSAMKNALDLYGVVLE